MASVSNPNAAVVAGNGLGPTTYIVSVDDVSAVSVATVVAEAQNEGHIVVAIEDDISSDGCMIALQGGGTPSLTGATVQATFTQNP